MSEQDVEFEPSVPERTLIDFEKAKDLTYKMIDLLNSPQSDDLLLSIAEKWDMQINEPLKFWVNKIEKNCKHCSGCQQAGEGIMFCEMGCFIRDGKHRQFCYWEPALEERLGKSLVVHEVFHAVFEDGFDISDMSFEEMHKKSEEFASWAEQNFTVEEREGGDITLVSFETSMPSISLKAEKITKSNQQEGAEQKQSFFKSTPFIVTMIATGIGIVTTVAVVKSR